MRGGQGLEAKYYNKTQRYNLREFWADHKAVLPLHYAVYLAEVGCKKAAAANVESVFSGAGKFASEAVRVGPTLLSRMIKLHYNWKYIFLRPTVKEIIKRYQQKFSDSSSAAATAEATAVGGG